MIKKNNLLVFFSLCINAGAIAGFCVTVRQAVENRYLHYEMYRLTALCLRENISRWVLMLLLVFMACAVIVFALGFCARLLPKVVEIEFSKGVLPGCDRVKSWFASSLLKKAAVAELFILLSLNMFLFIEPKINPLSAPNIVLLVVDCLRPDHLGCYGYERSTSPAIDRLADSGIIYRQAYSCAPWTKPSVASMFTSVYANEHGATSLKDMLPAQFLTVAEALKNRGYRTFFFNSGNDCIGEHYQFGQGFDHYYMPSGSCNADTLTDKFKGCLDGISKGERFFAYIHYMDTHAPYNRNRFNNLFTGGGSTYLKPGENYISSWHIRIMTANNKITEVEKDFLIALYDGQIRYVDENIKKLVGFLKKKNIFDNTVIIVTSDHGEEFWDHGSYEHGHSLYNEILHVPLILSGGVFDRYEVSCRVSLLDVFPSVLRLINNNKLSGNFRGIALQSADKEGTCNTRVLFSTGTLYGDEKYCLVKGDKKLIYNSFNTENKGAFYGTAAVDNFEIYDLHADPLEKHNMAGSPRGRAGFDLLFSQLQRFIKISPQFQRSQPSLSPQTLKRLKAMGYITN